MAQLSEHLKARASQYREEFLKTGDPVQKILSIICDRAGEGYDHGDEDGNSRALEAGIRALEAGIIAETIEDQFPSSKISGFAVAVGRIKKRGQIMSDEIAAMRVSGASYSKIANRFGISKQRAHKIMQQRGE